MLTNFRCRISCLPVWCPKIYRTVILPVVLYGYETWSVSLREELRLRMYENRVLRRIFGSERDRVTWQCRKLHNEKLYELYSPNIILHKKKETHCTY